MNKNSIRRLLARLSVGLLLVLAPVAARASITLTNASITDIQNALDNDGGVIFLTNTVAQTITVTSPLFVSLSTALVVTGTNSMTFSGGNTSQIFTVPAGVNLRLGNMILSGGNSTGTVGVNGTAGSNATKGGTGGAATGGTGGMGGAVYNLGNTLITNCYFLTNTAVGGAGGVGGNGGNGFSAAGAGGNGGAGGVGYGGVIYNAGILVLSNCAFIGNTAIGGNGGAGGANGTGPGPNNYPGTGGTGAVGAGAVLYNIGIATSWNCTFNNNFCQGGSAAAAGGPFQGNGSGANGSAGSAAEGGAVCNTGTNLMINCTIAANLANGGNGGNGGNASSGPDAGNGGNGGAGYGGSICNVAGLTALTNCTIADGIVAGGTNGAPGTGPFTNGVASIGGVFGANIANLGGTLDFKNSLLADPTNAANAYGTITDLNNNLSSDATPTFTRTNSFNNRSAQLEPLAFNGGPSATMAIPGTSPAVNAIYDNSAPAFDGRGVGRPIGPRADIGAYEYGTVNYSISGTVTVGTQHLPGISVSADSFYTSVTDVNGAYSFTNLPAGPYTIAIPSPTNFTPASVTLTLPPNGLDLNFAAPTNTVVTLSQASTNSVTLAFSGFAGINYLVQASTNLALSSWTNISTNRAAGDGTFSFTDFTTNAPARFYRAVAQ